MDELKNRQMRDNMLKDKSKVKLFMLYLVNLFFKK